MAITPNKRHLSDVNNDPYISNKRPRKKRSSLPRWRDDMKENMPPVMSRRTSQRQDPYPYTTSAVTSGRDLVKRGRYSPALVLPLPDTDVKPIVKSNGLLLLPRIANVLCVSLLLSHSKNLSHIVLQLFDRSMYTTYLPILQCRYERISTYQLVNLMPYCLRQVFDLYNLYSSCKHVHIIFKYRRIQYNVPSFPLQC